MNTSALMDAIGDVLREQIGRVDGDMDALRQQIDDRLSKLDSNLLVKGAAAAVMGANLRALHTVGENVTLRKSKVVSGTLPQFMAGMYE
jgi:hypothetical protein